MLCFPRRSQIWDFPPCPQQWHSEHLFSVLLCSQCIMVFILKLEQNFYWVVLYKWPLFPEYGISNPISHRISKTKFSMEGTNINVFPKPTRRLDKHIISIQLISIGWILLYLMLFTCVAKVFENLVWRVMILINKVWKYLLCETHYIRMCNVGNYRFFIIRVPGFRLYYNATVITSIWHRHKKWYID